MRHALSIPIAVVVLSSAVAFPVAAQGLGDKLYLAEGFVAEREFAAERSFDKAYRQRAVSTLAATLTLQQLDALASDPEAGRAILRPNALGSSVADLTYTPVVPCRVIDTRVPAAPIAGNTTRSFFVSGTTGFPTQGGVSGGCGVPVGATAAVLNIVAVSPSGAGYLTAFPYDEPTPPKPLAAVLNFGAISALPALANGTVVPLCDPLTMTCTFDILVFAKSTVHVVVDVAGYFQTFPTGDIMTTVLDNDGSGSSLDADTLDGFDSSAFGDITAVLPGTGLVGGATSGSATLGADTSYLQRRVTDTCPAGQSIRAISSTGTVTCEAGGSQTRVGGAQFWINAVSSSGTYGFSGTAWTAPLTGTCAVTMTARTDESSASGTWRAQTAREQNGTARGDNSDFHYGHQSVDSTRYSVTVTHGLWSITSGDTYRFGCWIDGDGSFTGNNFWCRVSYVCSSN